MPGHASGRLRYNAYLTSGRVILLLNLALRLQRNKRLRVIGFDDAPFITERGTAVNVSGVVCSGTRFEGMVWGQIEKDGTDSTQVLGQMLLTSKFANQVHLVLLDGLAVGGFNVIDLPQLAQRTQRPCVAVMRKPPNFAAIGNALENFDDGEQRLASLRRAGPIHEGQRCYFQASGCEPHIAALALRQLTDTGNVPEALRLAHLIGSAVMTGESGRRA